MTDKAIKNRLLIVDDEEDIRDMLRRHFQFLGYEVDTAENGDKALKIMANTWYDVVISDIMMPVMDGVDLLRNIKKDYPMTHVIMITGYVTMANILSCMRHGADTCIYKPLEELSELEEAVKYAVRSISTWKTKLKQLLEIKQ